MINVKSWQQLLQANFLPFLSRWQLHRIFFFLLFFFFKLNISLFQEYALNPAMKYCFVCFYRVEAKDTLLYCCCQIFYPISNFLFRNPKDFSSHRIFSERFFFFKLFIDDNSFFPPSIFYHSNFNLRSKYCI